MDLSPVVGYVVWGVIRFTHNERGVDVEAPIDQVLVESVPKAFSMINIELRGVECLASF